MTAAIARPPLFNHLLASRPDRDRSSLSATVLSVGLHAFAIAAVLALGGRIGRPRQIQEVYVPITPTPDITTPSRAPSVAGAGGGSAVQPFRPMPVAPSFLPTDIPASTPSVVDPGTVFDVVPEAVSPGVAPRGGAGAGGAETTTGNFTPYTVAPKLTNRQEMERVLQRYYPPGLLGAGIGGTTVIWLHIDEAGRVMEVKVSRASEHVAFDQAALRVGEAMRFTPAFNRDLPVRVWVEVPIIFNARN